ncbi:conserved domain protein [Paenibacillus sp. HGF5]|nr:conserved domain protein [Paenibacillus sp. HGF5]
MFNLREIIHEIIHFLSFILCFVYFSYLKIFIIRQPTGKDRACLVYHNLNVSGFILDSAGKVEV